MAAVGPVGTTLGTIAVQSGATRVVIALLQSKEWLHLKVQEMRPSITDVGHTLEEALQLLNQHRHVLEKLKTKQSPVEELLKQADEMIARQQPKAELYSAMAENLGTAWSELNSLLETRRIILELAVAFHTQAREFSEKMDEAQKVFSDLYLPSDVETCKVLLQKHLDEKKSLLELSMQTLTAGQAVVERLREVGASGMGDARPEHLRPLAQMAADEIERLTEALHDRRRNLEMLWASRKTRLEQCLQRCLLMNDIEQVVQWLGDKGQEYSSLEDLGSSATSTDFLISQHMKMEQESKKAQDRAIRCLSTAEQLSGSGHYAGQELRDAAYDILARTTDLLGALDGRKSTLRVALDFFNMAEEALAKLDLLEAQVSTAEVLRPNLEEYQARMARAVQQATGSALDTGHDLLLANQNAQGVAKKVSELEDRHNYLLTLLPRILEPENPVEVLANSKCEAIIKWLENTVDPYLKDNQSLGSGLQEARDFQDGHSRLQQDLRLRGMEMEALMGQCGPQQAEALRARWSTVSTGLEDRLRLAQRYVQFHRLAAQMGRELDAVQEAIRDGSRSQPEEKWLSCQQQWLQLQTAGNNFKDDARKTEISQLDLPGAVGLVDSMMESLQNRKNTVANDINAWKSRGQDKELWDQATREVYQIGKKVNHLEKDEIYPILPQDSNPQSQSMVIFLENQPKAVQKKIQDSKREVEALKGKVEKINAPQDILKKKSLDELQGHLNKLNEWQRNYGPLAAAMLEFFRNLADIESAATDPSTEPKLKRASDDADQLALRISQAEPKNAASQDRDVVYRTLESCKSKLSESLRLMSFQQDLQQISRQVEDLSAQLSALQGPPGESPAHARATSESLARFENTIEALEKRIVNFASTAEILMREHPEVQADLQHLQTKWSTFHRQVGDYQAQVELALHYFRLVEEVEEWIRDSRKVLQRRGSAGEETSRLISEVERLATPEQQERLRKISSLAIQLYGGPPSAVKELASQTQELTDSLSVMGAELKEPPPPPPEVPSQTAVPVAAVPFTTRPPVFTTPLTDTRVAEGGRCVFSCRVEADPAPEVRWYKAGVSIENNPDYRTSVTNGCCSLTIDETFTEDSGRYSCQAVNCAGRADTSAFLSVQEFRKETVAPCFVKELAPEYSVEPSAPLAMECRVEGRPEPDVTWFRGESPLGPGERADSGWCRLRLIGPGAGTYTCRAVNSVGSACSVTRVTLLRPSLPDGWRTEFVAPLSNVMARAGQKLRLEARLTGPQPSSLLWLHNNRPVKEGPDIKTSFDGDLATLTISEAFPKDAGLYTLVAQTPVGEISCSCTALVKGRLPLETSDSEFASDLEPIKPQVKEHLSDCTVLEGNPVRLDCVIVGQPEPEVIWYHNDEPVKESKDISLLFEGDRCSLLIKEAYLEDAGAFRCVAINSAGEAFSACHLHVESLTEVSDMEKSLGESTSCPRVVGALQEVTATEGSKVVLQCEVFGQPAPTVSWYKEGQPLVSSPPLYQVDFNPETGVASLTLGRATSADAGTYMVVATNSVGEARSYRTLIVSTGSRPVFLQYLENVHTAKGQPAELSCRLGACSPPPSVKWQLDGSPLPPSILPQQDPTSGRHWISVSGVSQQATGQYTIMAENPVGKAVSTARLTMEEPVSVYMKDDNIIEQRRTESTSVTRKTVVKQTTQGITDSLELHEMSAREERNFHQMAGHEPTEFSSSERQERHEVEGAKPLSSKMEISAALGSPELASAAPKFSKMLVGTSARLGQPVVLEGTVEGYPLPSVKWTKDGMELSPGHALLQYEGRKVRLEIARAERRDAGTYMCTASNIAGQVSSSAVVTVEDFVEIPPKFVRRLEDLSVRSGDRLTLTVEVEGCPVPEVQWYRDGSPLADSPDCRLKTVSPGLFTLTIQEVFPEDAGTYRVVASSSAGQTDSTARLSVADSDSADSEVCTTYRHVARMQEERKMYTKISMTCSPSPEPIMLEEVAQPAIEARIWSPTSRKEPAHIVPIKKEEPTPQAAATHYIFVSKQTQRPYPQEPPAPAPKSFQPIRQQESVKQHQSTIVQQCREYQQMQQNQQPIQETSMQYHQSQVQQHQQQIQKQNSIQYHQSQVQQHQQQIQEQKLLQYHQAQIQQQQQIQEQMSRESSHMQLQQQEQPREITIQSPSMIQQQESFTNDKAHDLHMHAEHTREASEPFFPVGKPSQMFLTPKKFVPKSSSDELTAKDEPLNIAPIWSPNRGAQPTPTWKPVQGPMSSRSDSPFVSPPAKTFLQESDNVNSPTPKPFVSASRVEESILHPSPKPFISHHDGQPLSPKPFCSPMVEEVHSPPTQPVYFPSPPPAAASPAPYFPKVGRVKLLTARFSQNLPASDL